MSTGVPVSSARPSARNARGPFVDPHAHPQEPRPLESAAAIARACERDPGRSTRSRMPRSRNSASSAVANALAGDSGLGVVIVELGESLFELSDPLLLLLVVTELAQERRVVIRSLGPRASTGRPGSIRTRPIVNQSSGPTTGRMSDEEHPGPLREGAHAGRFDEDQIDDRRDQQRDDHQGDQKAGHEPILSAEAHSGRPLRLAGCERG